jgi:hypothetical protein
MAGRVQRGLQVAADEAAGTDQQDAHQAHSWAVGLRREGWGMAITSL